MEQFHPWHSNGKSQGIKYRVNERKASTHQAKNVDTILSHVHEFPHLRVTF